MRAVVVGLGVAESAIRLLVKWAPADIPRLTETALDLNSFWFAACVAMPAHDRDARCCLDGLLRGCMWRRLCGKAASDPPCRGGAGGPGACLFWCRRRLP